MAVMDLQGLLSLFGGQNNQGFQGGPNYGNQPLGQYGMNQGPQGYGQGQNGVPFGFLGALLGGLMRGGGQWPSLGGGTGGGEGPGRVTMPIGQRIGDAPQAPSAPQGPGAIWGGNPPRATGGDSGVPGGSPAGGGDILGILKGLLGGGMAGQANSQGGGSPFMQRNQPSSFGGFFGQTSSVPGFRADLL